MMQGHGLDSSESELGQALVSQVPYNAGNFWTSKGTI